MQQKDRKQMYRQQTMGYFINAALEIIEEEGIDAQYLTYEMDPEEPETIQVAMLFSKGDLDSDLEDILDELEM